MVVYDSGDSDNLMQAMTANLNSAKEIFNRLAKGSAHLIEVIESGTLSGAAYEAVKALFVAYINPMLQKLAQAISDIESDLTAYRSADSQVRQYDNHLDDALIHQQLNNTKELIRLVQQKIEDDQNFVQDFMTGGFEGVANALGELPTLYEQLDNLEQVKTMHEQELAALEAFVSSTSPLFTDSLQTFNYAMQGVAIINQSTANFDGTINFPAGVDMSWLSFLEGETLYSGLLDTQAIGKLNTKGMSDSDKATYEQDVSNQVLWLEELGWSNDGIEQYIKYLNKEYSNYTAMGPKFGILALPTDLYMPNGMSYAMGSGKLVISGIYNFVGNLKTCKINEDSYSGTVNENIWTVTAPDGSQMTSAFLGFVGGYVPNLHYTQNKFNVIANDNTYAQNLSNPYIINGNPGNLSLSTPIYFLQDNLGANLTPEQKSAMELFRNLTLMNDAFTDAADPNRLQYVGGDIVKDGITQVAPVIAGELGDIYFAGLAADSLIPKLDQFNKLSDIYRGVNVERMTQIVDNIGSSQTRLTESQFQSLLEASDQNPGSKTTLLGGWDKNMNSYEQIANKAEYNYYDMGSAYNQLNDKILGAGGKINEVWLDQKIAQGNDFVLNINPEEAISENAQTGKYASLVKEIHKLQNAGYKIPTEPINGLWKVTK